jgi:hypothetical protein
MPRRVYIDFDCTLTQEHMYALFSARGVLPASSKSELGRFVAVIEHQADKIDILKRVLQRLRPFYQVWGGVGEESVGVLHKALAKAEPLLLPGEESLREDLREFLFGNQSRRDALSLMLLEMQSRGQEVTILTKGIGCCVIGALKSLMPHWLGIVDSHAYASALSSGTFPTSAACAATVTGDGSAVTVTVTGSSLSSASAQVSIMLPQPIRVVDYAGLLWENGVVSRATLVCSDKLLQIAGLLPGPLHGKEKAGEEEEEEIHALLVDDSAKSELQGFPDTTVVGRTPPPHEWDFFQVEIVQHTSQLLLPKQWPRDSVFKCIAGGPKKNSSGIQASDVEEILRVARL